MPYWRASQSPPYRLYMPYTPPLLIASYSNRAVYMYMHICIYHLPEYVHIYFKNSFIFYLYNQLVHRLNYLYLHNLCILYAYVCTYAYSIYILRSYTNEHVYIGKYMLLYSLWHDTYVSTYRITFDTICTFVRIMSHHTA
jgi:hypothetical protein